MIPGINTLTFAVTKQKTDMRKLYFTFVIFILSSQAILNAQVNKGAIFLGGDFSFSSQKTEDPNYLPVNSYSHRLSPVVGFAVRDNLVKGIFLVFSKYRNDYTDVRNNFKDEAWGGGVFIRKYKQIAKSDFALFLHGQTGIEFQNSLSGDSVFSSRYVSHIFRAALSIYPGISYRVNKKLQLETGFNSLLMIDYYHDRKTGGPASNPVNYTTNGFGLFSSIGSPNNLYIGFRLLLNKSVKEN